MLAPPQGQSVMHLARCLGPFKDARGNRAVKAGACDLFQKTRAFIGIGAQERVEIALSQQDRPAEFLIGQAGQGVDLLGYSRGLTGQHLLI